MIAPYLTWPNQPKKLHHDRLVDRHSQETPEDRDAGVIASWESSLSGLDWLDGMTKTKENSVALSVRNHRWGPDAYAVRGGAPFSSKEGQLKKIQVVFLNSVASSA